MRRLYDTVVNALDWLFEREECHDRALDFLWLEHERLCRHRDYEGGLVPVMAKLTRVERPETYARTAVRRVEDEVIKRLQRGFGI